ncbi:MAG: PH domain-containing protein [Duncaniella sp.]|nr:PH domain-containing protein [Duncaniella sp.]
MTDFSVPQRMSLSALAIYFLKFFRLTFNASVIYLTYTLFQSDGDFVKTILKIAVTIGCTALLSLILASLAIFKMKFHVKDGNLIYRHNLISRATTTIPLNRIHTLRTRQGLLYRLLDLRGVLFDTLAAKDEEIELVLSESDWQSLLDRIERQERSQSDVTDMPPAYNPSSFIEFSNKNLVFDALCQNHLKGMVVLGGFASVVFNTLSDLSENSFELIESYLESHFDHFVVSWVGIAMIMACTYIVSLVLWLGKVLLRYYNLSLTYDSKILTFSHGLFSRLSSRFSRDKICTICIKRNYFEKRFGLSTLALKQALNSSAQKEDDNLKIYGHDCSDFFLGWWLGQDYASEADIATAKSGKGVITHSLIPDLLLSSVAIVVLCHFGLYGWTILPVIYLSVGIPKGILTMRHSHITLKDSYLIINNGRFAEIKNYLKYDNVEVVRVTRTPLSRFTGRVSLSISTTGSTFTIRSLRQEQAMDIYERLLAKSIVSKGTAKE